MQPDEDKSRHAATIQRAWRAYRERKKGGDSKWKMLWNMLDLKEEFDFVKDHDNYESLKQAFQSTTQTVDFNELKEDLEDPLSDPTYLGPHIPKTIDLDTIATLISHFRKQDDIVAKLELKHKESGSSQGKPSLERSFSTKRAAVNHQVLLHKTYVIDICHRAEELMRKKANIEAVEFPSHADPDSSLTVVGDIHGQLRDLLYILELKGFPSEDNQFLFNGDFVDRGNFSAEVVLILYCLMLRFPNFVHLNRGNHEARDINSRDGFERECLIKWDRSVFDAFCSSFTALPIAHLIQGSVLVLHGGLSWNDFTLDSICQIDRFVDVVPQGTLFEDILWSDPGKKKGRSESDRGAGCFFGQDVFQKFMKHNGLRMLIRSHECVDRGWEAHFKGKLLTIFSASNYCDVAGNDGAILSFMKSTFPKPLIKPYYSVSNRALGHSKTEDLMSSITGKLVDRIACNVSLLREFWKQGQNEALTKTEWAAALAQHVDNRIPWITLYQHLPGIQESIDPQTGLLFHKNWLQFYDVQDAVEKNFINIETADASMDEKCNVDAVLTAICDTMFNHRHELESVFRWFDTDNSGTVSLEEFITGMRSLSNIGMLCIDESQNYLLEDRAVMEGILKRIDTNYNGEIEYDEFFTAFFPRACAS